MPTKRELEWLDRREEMPWYYCLWCPLWDNEADCDGRSPHPFCPMFNRREWLMGALVFEARVAAKLAKDVVCLKPIICGVNMINRDKVCPACRLKWARLKVEEEMDAAGERRV